jgi:hypothetical protein
VYPGCRVTLPRSALFAAQQSTTATAMARALLLAVFDRATLLSQQLEGEPSKRPGSEENVRLQKLDDMKLEAIYCKTFIRKFLITSHLYPLTAKANRHFLQRYTIIPCKFLKFGFLIYYLVLDFSN